MVGLSETAMKAMKREARGQGAWAAAPVFAPFEALNGGRAPENPFEQWISLFPTAPLFGVRWAFADMMKNAAAGAAPMFPTAAACAAPLVAPTLTTRATSPESVSHAAEAATLDGVASRASKHLRLVPIEQKPATKASPVKSSPAKSSPAKLSPAKPEAAGAAVARTSVAKAPASKPAAQPAAKKAAPKKKADAAPRGLMRSAPAKPDDLKQIRGVGEKLETVLNDIGLYTYAQVSSLEGADFEWLDKRLGVSRGRPLRDDWVGQAKALLAKRKK